MAKPEDLMVEALQALPLEYFDQDPEKIEAADYKDHASEFDEAMRLARVALHEAGKCGTSCRLCKQDEVDVEELLRKGHL